MSEFYKYLYAGGFALRNPYDYQKKISQKWESQPNVSSCPANFTPVIYTLLLFVRTIRMKYKIFLTCEGVVLV